MNQNNIHESWGSTIVFDSPNDFFKQDKNYWRDLLYRRKLLIFKKMKFSLEDYLKFTHYFGEPWKAIDYKYSLEHAITRNFNGKSYTTSIFNNKIILKINDKEMPWHSDIPNRKHNPFSIRSLWITKNPNPTVSGKTEWLNINLPECQKYLSNELEELLYKTKIKQQSWYYPGTDIQLHDFIKIHPVTNEKSLRLNFFNIPGKIENAWITDVIIDNILQPDCQLVKDYIDHLLKFEELKYTHQWDDFDIAIYDNYSFLHKRTALIFKEGESNVREFYRTNIDHLDSVKWNNKNF
jgi:alpha-ketoglutarate-dependent taurine dioxygenase